MKINEIIVQEGLGDWAKKVASKTGNWAKGKVAGAVDTAKQGVQNKVGQFKQAGQGIKQGVQGIGQGIANVEPSKIGQGFQKATQGIGQGLNAIPGSNFVKSTGRELAGAAKQIGKDLGAGGAATSNREFYGNMANRFQNLPLEPGGIYVVRDPNTSQEYFKNYQGKWYQHLGSDRNQFTITHPVTRPQDIEALEKLLPGASYVEVEQDPDITSSFHRKASGRKAAPRKISKKRGR